MGKNRGHQRGVSMATYGEVFMATDTRGRALVKGLAPSRRAINAAGAVMIVVFFTFGLSHPLPRRMGVILGVAVLLETMLVRLLLLPAVLQLLRERAWWVPSRLQPDGCRPFAFATPNPRRRQRARERPSRSNASRARRSFSSCPFAA